jgi:hypothetical protein
MIGSRPSAFNRIAPSAAMLFDETGSAASILTRHCRSRTHQQVNLAMRSHSEQAETEPSAKVPKPRIVFTPFLARRKASGRPNFVACRSAIDSLQNEFEVKGQLELGNHDNRLIIALQHQQIAAPDFTFDKEAEPFEEALTGRYSNVSSIVLPVRSSSKQASGIYVYNLCEAPGRRTLVQYGQK